MSQSLQLRVEEGSGTDHLGHNGLYHVIPAFGECKTIRLPVQGQRRHLRETISKFLKFISVVEYLPDNDKALGSVSGITEMN